MPFANQIIIVFYSLGATSSTALVIYTPLISKCAPGLMRTGCNVSGCLQTAHACVSANPSHLAALAPPLQNKYFGFLSHAHMCGLAASAVTVILWIILRHS